MDRVSGGCGTFASCFTCPIDQGFCMNTPKQSRSCHNPVLELTIDASNTVHFAKHVLPFARNSLYPSRDLAWRAPVPSSMSDLSDLNPNSIALLPNFDPEQALRPAPEGRNLEPPSYPSIARAPLAPPAARGLHRLYISSPHNRESLSTCGMTCRIFNGIIGWKLRQPNLVIDRKLIFL